MKYLINASPKTNPNNIIIKDNLKVSVLTNNLIRIEVNNFIDYPTQAVLNRDFSTSTFTYNIENNNLIIKTLKVTFIISLTTLKLTKVIFKNNKVVEDFYSQNLKGTYRTLDGAVGEKYPELQDGVLSRNGVAILDDSNSYIIDKENLKEIKNRNDIYVFAYGNDYLKALNDFYNLTGKTPLIPRFALGNWWSRYYPYKQDEYLALMDKFKEKEIPLTVAVIDMDWHYVDIAKRFGKLANYNQNIKSDRDGEGWTGYSWNKDLFYDYKEFLEKLHDKNLKVTLNLHPALGVRAFENQYEKMCEYVKQDPKELNAVEFKMHDLTYVHAYFDVLLHPYEKDGVDFWWIDWQQGTTWNDGSLDPLWSLNHYHFIDNDQNKRGIILSRYSGIGSHRYPLGFSGDTYMDFKSLDYEPYFTLTASNIGYSWWSHDIGGHMYGIKDNELYIRWLQFGVFSPINRLHSSSNIFLSKEPWVYNYPIEVIATNYLRLRHKLIPYLYSLNYINHNDNIPLIRPLYYYHHNNISYKMKNEYYFGSELLVSPITTKTNKITTYATCKTYFPKGRWTDIFTNQIYEGNKVLNVNRELNNYPVFAKQGAIIPTFLNDRTNDYSINQDLEIYIYRGNNKFKMFEDDGESKDYLQGKYAIYTFKVKEIGNDISFDISFKGDITIYKTKRDFVLSFKDLVKGNIYLDGKEMLSLNKDYLQIRLNDDHKKHHVEIKDAMFLQNMPIKEALTIAVSKFQMGNYLKEITFNSFDNDSFYNTKKKCINDVTREIKYLK